MRSIWKGAISFGLVTIPVKLHSATEQKDVAFHQVHRTDGGRIRYKRVCTIDGEEVSYSDIAKGYELPLSTSRRIDVLQFTPLEQVDPVYFSKTHYLEPDAQGVKPYVLLRDALEDSDRVAVVKVALRQRESLGTLRVRDGVFVLETMLWPDEVREADFPFLEEDVDVRPQELQMASSLIETMTSDFDPTDYKDAYREALQEIIEAKIEGREIVAPEAPEEAPAAADLLSALRASVEAAKKGRADEGDGEARKAAGSAKGGSHARKDGAAKSGTAKAGTAKGGAEKTADTKAKAKSGTRKTA